MLLKQKRKVVAGLLGLGLGLVLKAKFSGLCLGLETSGLGLLALAFRL